MRAEIILLVVMSVSGYAGMWGYFLQKHTQHGSPLWNWSDPDALQCLHKEIVRRGLVPTFLQAHRSWQGGAAVPILRYHSYMAPVSYLGLGSRSNTSYGNMIRGNPR
ncbi:hypothetical protein DFP73DRAFT_555067 [Morchella snyderi]|nr:hypothetical protein DFP73DRAFT_555067 [Morchella snyderi]